ncbi:MAG TPA: hypothetical protein VKP30_30840, partial [Polyangiaceae bacterium]|nr:hypothetical protein [Polyangiaceae bacterium]
MSIDWTSFQGHTATAGQIPAYLQALVSSRGATRSEREDKRGGAYEYLFAQLVKDGQWLPVSPHVASELVSIARTDAPGRWRVLRLLGEIVSGKHQWWLAQGIGREREIGEFEAATRQAVLPLHDDACRMLDDGDPSLRSAAAFFLGCLGEPNEAAQRRLEAQIAEEEVNCALASEILALAVLQVNSGTRKL